MEAALRPSRLARFDRRNRQRAEQPSPPNKPAHEQARKEEDLRPASIDEPLLAREGRGRVVMGDGHRQFHRRAAQAQAQASAPPAVATVLVQEMVDGTGNIVAVATTVVPPLPPPVPTAAIPAVPAVPAVPPFPSDLVVPTVPPFPFPTAAVNPTAVNPTATLTLGQPQPPSATTVLPTFSGFNSTSSSSASSTPLSSSLSSSSSPTPTPTSTSSSTRSSTSSSSSQSSPSPTPSSSQSSSTLAASSTSSFVGGGGGGVPNTAAPPGGAPTAAVANTQSSSTSPLGTPQVIGTVFGSLAGAALILALILFLIKRHKQKQRGTHQLTGDGDTDQHQPMAQSAARTSYATPSFLNRFSSLSRSTAESSGTGERSFQRVSGRKLPSAFSEGMTSEQFANQGTLSGSSFYTDDKGFYGGAGVMSKDFGKEIGKEIGETTNTGTVGKDERVMPSPARTPVIHHPEDAPPWGASRNGGAPTMSPPHTPVNPFVDPAPPPRGALGRSRLSHDGSRSSRFTENV